MQKTAYVDVFLGNGAVKTEPLDGIAAVWHPIKAMTGNTTPAAQLPFGKLSVCSYSGAYPCGSGINRISTCPPCRFLYDKKKIYGMTHLRHSGTGAIGYYYNYALLWCGTGAFALPELHNLTEEAGRPGYYAATDADSGVRYASTTDALAVRHRVTLPAGEGFLAVDFSNDGLYPGEGNLRGEAGAATLTVTDGHTVTAAVELRGVTLFFALHCTGASPMLWLDGHILEDKQLTTDGGENRRFGCVFEVTGTTAEAALSISLRSGEKALRDNAAAREKSFDSVCASAENAWEEVLSRIDVEGSEREKQIFYSNLYHTLVKPADWSGESWKYSEEECVLDFTTLWDIYKTQTPLVFSLYPGISRKMIASYCHFARYFGCMPNSIGVNSTLLAEANQALLLAGYLFSDAYYRGVPGVDWKAAFTLLDREMEGGIPGNNDSGGLSACFLWNAMGIFPVTGQDRMLVGSPHYEKTVLHLANGKTFTVRREGKGIYVQSATLDGLSLTETPLSFTVRRMMQGGELVVKMRAEKEPPARR